MTVKVLSVFRALHMESTIGSEIGLRNQGGVRPSFMREICAQSRISTDLTLVVLAVGAAGFRRLEAGVFSSLLGRQPNTEGRLEINCVVWEKSPLHLAWGSSAVCNDNFSKTKLKCFENGKCGGWCSSSRLDRRNR